MRAHTREMAAAVGLEACRPKGGLASTRARKMDATIACERPLCQDGRNTLLELFTVCRHRGQTDLHFATQSLHTHRWKHGMSR